MATAAVVTVLVLVLASCRLVAVGGPSNTFGNDPTRVGDQPGFWAAINGPYTDRADGDPYATKCAGSAISPTTCDSAGANPSYSSSGYLWGIDVPAGSIGIPVTVAVYDPGMSGNSALLELVWYQTFATSYDLFDTTGTPDSVDLSASNSMKSLGRCGSGPGSKVFAAGSVESAGAWYSLCTFTPTRAGVYPLQVRSSGIPGVTDAGGGYNSFAIRATTTSGPTPTVAGIGMTSLTLDGATPSTRSYLTSIGSAEAGKTLTVDLFDIGDGTTGSLPATVQVLAPPSGVPAIRPTGGTPVSCRYNATGSASFGPATPNSSPTCLVTTEHESSSVAIYNRSWLRLSIPIPLTYTCTADCWWSLLTNRGNGTTPLDRTVVQVNIQ
ncbi:MAG: hypothetical protein ACXWA3_04010 [Acidimicrobiales bacterium]